MHPSEHLLQLSNDLKRIALDIILVHSSIVLIRDFLQLRQLFIDNLSLADGNSFGEGAERTMSSFS